MEARAEAGLSGKGPRDSDPSPATLHQFDLPGLSVVLRFGGRGDAGTFLKRGPSGESGAPRWREACTGLGERLPHSRSMEAGIQRRPWGLRSPLCQGRRFAQGAGERVPVSSREPRPTGRAPLSERSPAPSKPRPREPPSVGAPLLPEEAPSPAQFPQVPPFQPRPDRGGRNRPQVPPLSEPGSAGGPRPVERARLLHQPHLPKA